MGTRLLPVLCLLVIGCSSAPQNFQGKRFGANSAYCSSLWSGGHSLHRNNLQLARPGFNPANYPVVTAVSQMDRAVLLDDYEKNCESQDAYHRRKELNLLP